MIQVVASFGSSKRVDHRFLAQLHEQQKAANSDMSHFYVFSELDGNGHMADEPGVLCALLHSCVGFVKVLCRSLMASIFFNIRDWPHSWQTNKRNLLELIGFLGRLPEQLRPAGLLCVQCEAAVHAE